MRVSRLLWTRRPTGRLLFICFAISMLSIMLTIALHKTLQIVAMPREITENKETFFFDDSVPWIDLSSKKVEQNKILSDTSSNKLLSRGVTPMYIVEEHHQVIPHWYGAAESGLLADGRQATLVHIDAHSDMGSPSITPSFPVYRWPARSEWPLLMTENDEFIVASAMTGMFSRLIWVYPDWDDGFKDDPQFYSSHVIANITAGLEIPDHPVNETQRKQLPCACAKPLNWPYSATHKKLDFLNKYPCVSFTNRTEDREERPLPLSKCKLSDRTIRIETIKESKMLEMMRNKDPAFMPIQPGDSWILDIDEDFFGVEPSVLPLYNANMTDGKIDLLTSWITQLFCSKSGADELAADLAFQKLIFYVRYGTGNTACESLKRLMKQIENAHYDMSDIFEYPSLLVPLFNKQVLCGNKLLTDGELFVNENGKKTSFEIFPNFREVLCPHIRRQDRAAYLGTVTALLYRLTDGQLKALAQVGICLWSIMKPDNDRSKNRMRVCDGFNRPNEDSAVTFYTPKPQEITQRGSTLKTILNGLSQMTSTPSVSKPPVTPSLVTVCRSARDGYTPRHMMPRIEGLVLGAVKDVFGKSKIVEEVYDPDLFGGVPGWLKRPRVDLS